ncbi:HAD family hydrolase [Rhodobacteraceae bacterium KMM 6894]|nr:HAD family hydrolase [Rhodobacteraceae bacterium KMM 6894]
MTDTTRIDGIIFDKDGTLFDFHTTWSNWARSLIEHMSDRHDVALDDIARAIAFDLAANRFLPGSVMISANNRECAEALAKALPNVSVDEVEHQMVISSADAELAPVVPLAAFLDGLAARGLKIGLMTNDSEHGARAHLSSAGVLDRFDFVAGYDSGHGHKPDADPLLAFARIAGLTPARVAMVGDSTHDLIAARAAGMQSLGVLTGVAEAAELTPHADRILPDIGHIPAWLDE